MNRIVRFLIACALTMGSVSAATPVWIERNKDFIAAPVFSLKNLDDMKALRDGSVKVAYAGGKITAVTITTSSGNAEVDRLLREHILRTYQVRPGKSGKASLPFHFDTTGRARVTYQNGVITRIEMVDTTFSPILDRQIIDHIQTNFHVKAGRSGVVFVPVSLRW